jgi:hypothetical protein
MKKTLIALTVLALCACASIPFSTQLNGGYTAVTTISTLTDGLLTDGVITSAQAATVQTEDANLKLALDQANTVYLTDQATGGNQLATAVAALAALDVTVVAFEAKPTTGAK